MNRGNQKGKKMIKKISKYILISVLIIIAFSGCQKNEDEIVVGRVNDVEITLAEFNKYYKVSLNS